ncbi:MAG: hypothetical protein K9W46_11025 [Candidatus Heimdallarchaeum endolithica]|uniref:DUF3899 domain-containing protein n=1 Tax=Candidatus Heimdallarchaeum endolithica TaxID=2876572 RepID=A0A9Y1FNQ4_9ARCH|nr:MAG: hypothetical protein K9W46_11025 [Candidatus Heimdallarchaeum endolithica]
MLEKVHDHIIEELKVNTTTDRIFILTALLLNLITLGVNTGLAYSESTAGYISFSLFLVLAGIINWVVVVGLTKGKQNREKLILGLVKMYKDQGMDKYYDTSVLESYRTRYKLFTVVVVATGVLAFLIPLVVMLLD